MEDRKQIDEGDFVMKRCFIFILIAVLLTFTACGEAGMNSEAESAPEISESDPLDYGGDKDAKALADEILEGLSEDVSAVNELIFYGGSADLDGGVEINGATYYPVNGELKSISDIAELLDRVYSEDRARELMSEYTEGESPIFIGIGGALYRQDAHSPGESFLLPVNNAEKISDDKIKAEAERGAQDEYSAVISIVKEGGKWKIGGVEYKLKPVFENAYELAVPDIPADGVSSVTELDQKGLAQKIFEAKFIGDNTACLIGREVRSDNGDDPDIIYANRLSVGVSSDSESFFAEKSADTVCDAEGGYYRIFKSKINEYISAFDLEKGGETCRIIALRYYADPEEEVAPTVFFALIDNELTALAGDFSEAVGGSFETRAQTSSALVPDGDAILDLSTGILYTFDFPISRAEDARQYTAAISPE